MAKLTTQELFEIISDKEKCEQFLLSWPRVRCQLCRNRAATAVWIVKFAKKSPPYVKAELKCLCPACGMTDAYVRWNGFMAPKCVRVDLFLTITCPEGDKRSPADHLIEKISSHPQGAAYLNAWKLMFKPANLSHPIDPALNVLRALKEKLFPPPSATTSNPENKVD